MEVFKHDCPSCQFNGKVFNVFSRKLKKHRLLHKLPCYRLNIDNKVPYLGQFFYSPIYFYVRVDDGEVKQVAILDIPAKYDLFIEKLRKYSTLNKELQRIKVHPRA